MSFFRIAGYSLFLLLAMVSTSRGFIPVEAIPAPSETEPSGQEETSVPQDNPETTAESTDTTEAAESTEPPEATANEPLPKTAGNPEQPASAGRPSAPPPATVASVLPAAPVPQERPLPLPFTAPIDPASLASGPVDLLSPPTPTPTPEHTPEHAADKAPDSPEDTPSQPNPTPHHSEPHSPIPTPIAPLPLEPQNEGPVQNAPVDEEEMLEQITPGWKNYASIGIFGELRQAIERQEAAFDTTAAETRYLERLSMDISDAQRRQLLLEMASMFERNHVRPKVAAVYEKFIETFPRDPIVPEIYMRLGFLYRDIGAFRQALSRFYAVLNASLAVPVEKAGLYRMLSLKAQLEIADTHYSMGDFDEAAKLFRRLQRLELSPEDLAVVTFKLAYCHHLLNNHSEVIGLLTDFIDDFPNHSLVPESHYILANTYRLLKRPVDAINQTLTLLRHQQASDKPEDNAAQWLFWKKRTGNQLANELYEQGDFVSALRIYQAMAELSTSPEWQWPVVYQIGLCFERLRMYPRAIQAYEHILKPIETEDGSPPSISPKMKEMQDLAQWRLDHLLWLTNTETRLSTLLNSLGEPRQKEQPPAPPSPPAATAATPSP